MSDRVAVAERPVARVGPRPGLIKAIRGTGWTFIWIGFYLLGFVAYQLWFTNIVTAREQSALENEVETRFETVAVEEVPFVPQVVDPEDPLANVDPIDLPEFTQEFILAEPQPELGEGFAQMRIPAIDVDVAIIEGVRRRDLKKGPGHLTGSPLPGQPGNSVISGHRTTYGAPFGDLDQLQPGDLIEVDTAVGTHTYVVREAPERCADDEGRCIVPATGLWVTDPREGGWLTLTTCHPKFSSRNRLIVFAEMVEGPNAATILGA